ncbi:hypothetical protein PAXRUDRAFT_473329 [Paxillus rubicundulus Ve08.2h10]|uniref:Unplaced genomic scaffold scaffold_3089, whole genome shotgun sequence n=1 Tax=Paxillus rubicundulus Ve08.2h10 TaxID=930991 RepID=A0A0D0CKH1_9AGAM|nr:hypothetical protein PAXRUDRAFT_473329 [Paxillus rubicundulus Ve08.2h10]
MSRTSCNLIQHDLQTISVVMNLYACLTPIIKVCHITKIVETRYGGIAYGGDRRCLVHRAHWHLCLAIWESVYSDALTPETTSKKPVGQIELIYREQTSDLCPVRIHIGWMT